MFGWLKKWGGGARKSVPPFNAKNKLYQSACRDELARPCAPLLFEKPANIDPFATMFGAVRLSLRDETWPVHDGAAMWPLCQINMIEASHRPSALVGLSLTTVFVDAPSDKPLSRVIDTRKSDRSANWVLRSYPTLTGLTIPKISAHSSPLSPRLGEWGDICIDPSSQACGAATGDTETNGVTSKDWSHSVQQTKIGGWPAPSQRLPWWAQIKSRDTWDFVMQIANEPKAGWQGWGLGMACIARSRERPHLWAIDVLSI